MKKPLQKRLTLTKETLRALENARLHEVLGGNPTMLPSCVQTACTTACSNCTA